MRATDPEVSDLITQFDTTSLVRLPVRKSEVISRFLQSRNRQAARVVAGLPEQDGFLDPHAVDRLLIKTHCEMQRMAEEFHHGSRVRELLRPLLRTLRQHGFRPPLRLVDIGCGTGFAIRWLAALGDLGDDVELVGVDFNDTLVAEAQRLAALENLKCRFMRASAFSKDVGGHVFFTTGVVHHFRGDSLTDFFRNHERSGVAAFVHFDFKPSPLAHPGSWFFHYVRMRTALARHDGVLSALRAHSATTLLEAAKSGAPSFRLAMYGERIWNTPLPRVFHSIVGVQSAMFDTLRQQLGRRAARLREPA
jgi:SAM-dependent methyltransferase